jgi:AcrR family transcriptional regulator
MAVSPSSTSPSSTAASARPGVTAKGRATRDRIVVAAAALIFDHGVESTTLDDIGEAAGVGRSQLYHYFADKADLVRAVIDRQTEQILAAQRPLLGAMDSWEAWARWRNAIVGVQRARQCAGGCPIGSLASELADTDEDARVALAAGFDRWGQEIHEGVRSMQRQGHIRTDADTDALALATLASLQGGLLLCQVHKDVRPLEAALDAAIAHLRSFAPSRSR